MTSQSLVISLVLGLASTGLVRAFESLVHDAPGGVARLRMPRASMVEECVSARRIVGQGGVPRSVACVSPSTVSALPNDFTFVIP